MRTVYKYVIEMTDEQKIDMRGGAEIIHVGLDPSRILCAWAIVDTTQPSIPVSIWVVGTGNPIPDGAKQFLASFVQGRFVWHIFRD